MVQEVLEGIAEAVAEVDGVNGASAEPPTQIKTTPFVLLSWFSDVDTAITTMSDQLWIVSARAQIFCEAIKGNPPAYPIIKYQNLIHPIVDVINKHPQTYPYGSKLASLEGLSRVNVVRVRPAEFSLEYAGHKYFGATLFLDIKLHRGIEY